MARAIATRFCIPPLISPGYLFCASIKFTRSKQNWARFTRSRYVSLENISNGNITFSSTVRESNKAALWKIIPISRRNVFFLFIHVKEVASVIQDLALFRSQQTDDTLHQYSFSRTALTDNQISFTIVKSSIDIHQYVFSLE